MSDSNAERVRLESIASNSLYAAGLGPDTIRYSKRIFSRYIRGDSILEMGPAEGVMTESLVGLNKSLTVVEGAKAFCDDLKRRFPDIQVVHSLFEAYAPQQQ